MLLNIHHQVMSGYHIIFYDESVIFNCLCMFQIDSILIHLVATFYASSPFRIIFRGKKNEKAIFCYLTLYYLCYYIGEVDKRTTFYFCIVLSQSQIVLNMFLFLATFQPQCSYKIVLIKKKIGFIP